jgi:glutathione S-transferase
MSPDKMKLYEWTGSPNSRRVRIYLAEKGLAIPRVPVDLDAKDQFSPEYTAINPRRVVPTLVLEDGTAIGEVLAIWRYLEESYPEPPLIGSTPKEKATIIMWERRAEQEGFAPVMDAMRNSTPGLRGHALTGPYDYEQIPELARRGIRRIADFYSDLDLRLKDFAFVAGDRFSTADITALVTVDFAAKAVNQPIPAGHDNLKRWYDKVAARPSAGA